MRAAIAATTEGTSAAASRMSSGSSVNASCMSDSSCRWDRVAALPVRGG
jgi:hypothetical protein